MEIDIIRVEVRHGKKSPVMVVVFEEATNYDLKKHEWTPKADEMDLVSETFSLLSRKEKPKQ